MVDLKTEPEATTTTNNTTTTTTTDTTEQSEQLDDNVGTKIKSEVKTEQDPITDNNDSNNNGSCSGGGEGGGGGQNEDDDDDDDAEFEDDEDHESNNQIVLREDNAKTNLIVNYLPQQMTDEEFENLFVKFGKMKSCKIVRNRVTHYSYGFGFVDFETHEQALKAIEELNGQEVDTKKIKVAFARPAGQDIKQANLYVKNVPSSWSQDDVRKVFEPYGSIIQVRVLGNDRGVAFVLFDLRKQAQDALDALNGKQVAGCEEPFEIKFAAEKKGEKRRGSRGGGGNKNNMNRRGGNRGSGNFGPGRNNQNQSNNNNSNNINNNNRNNRSNSGNRRSTSQGRGGNMYNNNNGYGNMNGSVGPMRQQQTNRSNRYAPFVPVQQPPMAPQPTPMTPYGYAQQPMLPYMMTGQPMMQMPMGHQPMSLNSAPVNPYSMGAQMGPIGYVQPPMAQAPTAISNMYNVASNTMNNAAQMQPQLGQPMNMKSSSSGGGGGGGGGGGQNDGVTLFVYNIGPDCDENELKGMFNPYGTVVRCNVVRKTPGGETKGFGFVTLRSRDHANAAIAGLNNTMRNGRSLQVSFKK